MESTPSASSPPGVPTLWPFPRLYYGWAIVGTTLVATFATAPLFGPVLGVFVRPIGDDLEWSRTTMSLGFTIGIFGGSIFRAAIGAYLDRHGARGVMAVAGVVVAGCMLGIAVMTQPWHFWTLLGFGLSVALAGVHSGTTVTIANWFIRKRGRAMAIGATGLRAGNAALPIMIHAIIVAFSWRHAYAVLAGMAVLLIVAPGTLFMRRRPEDLGLQPDGVVLERPAPPGQPQAASLSGGEVLWTLRQAIHTRSFWLLVVAMAGAFSVHSSLSLHAVANFQDQGISAGLAVSIATIFSAVGVFAGLAFGFLTERVHVRYSALIVTGMYIVTLGVISVADTYTLAVLFGLVFGIAGGGLVIVERLIFADYFGRRSVGAIRGFAAPFRAVVTPLGPLLTGVIRDMTGSYTAAFVILGGMCVVVLLAMLLAVPPRMPAEVDSQR